MRKILGIDLGTTNSCVAVWNGHSPGLIPLHNRERLLPSVVGFSDGDELFLGKVALRQALVNADRTIYSSKCFIGRPFAAVGDDRQAVPYEVAEGPDGETCFHVDYMLVTPEEIAAVILRELRQAAEAFLGEPVDSAVIAVPAHFNDAQRAATKEAGRLAGLNVLRLINEPTAAALAYGLGKVPDRERIVAVYDFGGGTFDVSILSVADEVVEVIATNGDTHLGGDLIDSRIARMLIDHFEAQTGIPVDEDAETFQRVREAAERAKIGLSTSDVVEIDLPFLESDSDGPMHLQYSLSRETLDAMIGDLVERTLTCCDQVLADAGRVPREIDEVLLVGGSSRIPMVQECVASYFGRQPRHNVHPDEVVALGAAVEGAVLSGELKGVMLIDVTSLSLGIETYEGLTSVVTPRNTTIPVTARRVFTTSCDDQVDVQFHVVQGEEKSAELNDSLGRFVLDGLRPAKAGEVQIEVSLTVDADGMVQVRAKDLETGRAQSVTVSAATATRPRPLSPSRDEEDLDSLGDAGGQLEALGLPPMARVELEGTALAEAVSGMNRGVPPRPFA